MTHHPTIRTIAGAPAPESLDPKTTALLAIDFQNEYFVGRMPIPDGEKALANAKRLIARADAERMKVYHVKHVTPAGSPSLPKTVRRLRSIAIFSRPPAIRWCASRRSASLPVPISVCG